MTRLGVPKKPVDLLRDMAAPKEIVEWVRKMPVEDAPRTAWIDVAKADWLPYVAGLRGFTPDAVLKAASAVLFELAEREATRLEQGAALLGNVAPPLATPGPTTDTAMPRLVELLKAGADQGRTALAGAEPALEDLRLALIARGEAPDPPPWAFWTKLVLELARSARRGNLLVGVALAMRMLIDARGRRANTDVIARFRDKLTLG